MTITVESGVPIHRPQDRRRPPLLEDGVTEYEETHGAEYDVFELEQAVSALFERLRLGAGDDLRKLDKRLLDAASGLWSLVEILGLRRAA